MSAATEIETNIFSDTDLDDRVDCSYTDCDVEATHMLQCPEDQMCETMCQLHTEETALVKILSPFYSITFDNTCGHSPAIGDCNILPLVK